MIPKVHEDCSIRADMSKGQQWQKEKNKDHSEETPSENSPFLFFCSINKILTFWSIQICKCENNSAYPTVWQRSWEHGYWEWKTQNFTAHQATKVLPTVALKCSRNKCWARNGKEVQWQLVFSPLLMLYCSSDFSPHILSYLQIAVLVQGS